MTKVVAGLSMSLDGYINDENGSVERLYPDFELMSESEPMKASIRSTGAVIMGRGAFEMSPDPDWYMEGYEYQVPIFVLTHHPPAQQPKTTGALSFTFVTDGIESAVRQARAAAGERDVTIIGGASTIRQALAAGLVDELSIDVMPVILGGGLRLFEGLGRTIELERVGVAAQPAGRTGLVFRISK